MNISKIISRVALTTIGCAASAWVYAQGIPTADVAAAAQRMVALANQVQQVEQAVNSVKALTGNSGVGLANQSATSYLPSQWESIYSKVQGGSLGSVSSSAQQIMTQEGLNNAATPAQQRYNNTLAANKAMSQAAYDAANTRAQNIQSLMQQSNSTQSAADKADLQNRLQAETALTNTEQTRLQMASKLQEAETALADHQRAVEQKNSLLGISTTTPSN